jgi:AbrB family looped-hinge helix DNA binding protein
MIMEKVTVSSKGQIAIPKAVRDALNLREGSKLTVEVRGREIVLSKELAWRKLQGAAADQDLMSAFAAFKGQEREREDSRS